MPAVELADPRMALTEMSAVASPPPMLKTKAKQASGRALKDSLIGGLYECMLPKREGIVPP